MGQAANNGGRRATLDRQKERAAGRQNERGRDKPQADDFDTPDIGHGRTKGAFGKPGAASAPRRQAKEKRSRK